MSKNPDYRCPKCGHNRFTVTAKELRVWLVDQHANFIEDFDCLEGEIESNSDWECYQCEARFAAHELVDLTKIPEEDRKYP